MIKCDNKWCAHQLAGKCNQKEISLTKRWSGSEENFRFQCLTYLEDKDMGFGKPESPYV